MTRNPQSPEGACADAVLALMRSEWPYARNLLEKLVGINSHTCNREGVEENAAILIKEFAPMGFVPRRVTAKNDHYAPHLILDNHAEGPAILMVAHLDTVYTPEEQESGFLRFETPDGLLTGPGTMDIKGGSVMMWLLLRAWSSGRLPDLPPVRWILAWNSSEEPLNPDFSASLVSGVPTSTAACLVFEADNLRTSGHEILTARKGLARWNVRVRGRGAHSGNAHREGMNAILRLAGVVQEIEALTDYRRGLTLNVGLMQGGNSTNRVPDAATASFEVRYVSTKDYQEVRQCLLTLNETGCFDAPAGERRCEVQLEPVTEIAAWCGDQSTKRLVSIWKAAARKCGYEVSTGSRGGLSDANFLGHHFPTLDGLGPRGGNAHTIECVDDRMVITEFVEPDSFLTKGVINLMALRDLVHSCPAC